VTGRGPAGPPLAGVTILAVEQYGAGPYATMVLADLGADVVKIEPPGRGDVGRGVPPYADGTDSLFFESFNRGKKSVVLDLKSDPGQELFQRLVRHADVVFTNGRAGTAERLGLTFAQLRHVNPAIVCVFLTGFGRVGPRAEHPGYDYVVQALSGLSALTGEPDGPPGRAGFSVVDFAAGLAAGVAMLAGVVRARATGEGGDLDTSLFETALSFGNYLATWTLSRGYQGRRLANGAHPSIVPSQFFATADGWVMVMCQTDGFYRALVTRMGLEHLFDDPRFTSFELRLAHRDELIAVLVQRFRERATDAWLEVLEGHVPIAPVRDLRDALHDPQAEALGMISSYEHPRLGTVQQVGGPVRATVRHQPARPGPALGGDTRELLARWAEVDDDSYERLREDGVVG
jgi:crotonobetainyl-CoA:carnitine CoA-transferase CaiB-like acyl-CoA transferase